LPIFDLFSLIPGFSAGLLGVAIGTHLKPDNRPTILRMHKEFLRRAELKMSAPLSSL